MVVRFSANGDTGLGYRGRIRYLTRSDRNKTVDRSTHCGGYVETFGGAITMMNMVGNNSEKQYFDCIWLIKPPNNYMHLKTHLLLRIEKFEKMGTFNRKLKFPLRRVAFCNVRNWIPANESSVQVREGITSESPLLEHFDWPRDEIKPFKNLVTALSSGFYVSFRGVFDESTQFIIIYTAFSYMGEEPGRVNN